MRVGERHVAFIGKDDYGYDDSEGTAEDERLVHSARAEADRLLASALGSAEGGEGNPGVGRNLAYTKRD